MSGKGDNPRPLSVPQDEFNAKWDAIDWGAREREASAERLRARLPSPRKNRGAADHPELDDMP